MNESNVNTLVHNNNIRYPWITHMCMVCGAVYHPEGEDGVDYNYCPRCGVKIETVEEELK